MVVDPPNWLALIIRGLYRTPGYVTEPRSKDGWVTEATNWQVT
jgi:hypothetical protein